VARLQLDDLTNAAKDAAYVSVGLSVIAFQRLQVRRHELTKALESRSDEARGVLEVATSVVGDRVKMVEERLGAVLDISRR
jgi:hypothetical protein